MAATLCETQRSAGHDSHHFWAINSTLWSEPLSAPLHTLAAGIDQFVLRSGAFGSPISLLRDRARWKLEATIKGSDVIHLHSVNGLGQVGALCREFPNKKFVWTMHDMNPFTGACHYTLGCKKFSEDCSSCPAVKAPFQGLVRQRFQQKLDDLDGVENLRLVAPSQWLADAAKESKLLSRFPLDVIANPLDKSFVSREIRKIPAPYSFIVVAQNLDDPVKDVVTAVQAFITVRKKHPNATLALVGMGGGEFVDDGINKLGVMGRDDLAQALRSSQTLVVPSRAENAPMVIAEASSQGCFPLVRDTGGMPGMIEKLGAGRTFRDTHELVTAMIETLSPSHSDSEVHRSDLIRQSQRLFSPEAVREQYDKVYER